MTPTPGTHVRLWIYDTQYSDGFYTTGVVTKVSPKRGYFLVTNEETNQNRWYARFLSIDREAQISDTLIATYLGPVNT